jgi:hypothetical protein
MCPLETLGSGKVFMKIIKEGEAVDRFEATTILEFANKDLESITFHKNKQK